MYLVVLVLQELLREPQRTRWIRAGLVQRDQWALVLMQAPTWTNVDTTVASGSGFGGIDGSVHQDACATAVKLGLMVGVTDVIYGPSGL